MIWMQYFFMLLQKILICLYSLFIIFKFSNYLLRELFRKRWILSNNCFTSNSFLMGLSISITSFRSVVVLHVSHLQYFSEVGNNQPSHLLFRHFNVSKFEPKSFLSSHLSQEHWKYQLLLISSFLATELPHKLVYVIVNSSSFFTLFVAHNASLYFDLLTASKFGQQLWENKHILGYHILTSPCALSGRLSSSDIVACAQQAFVLRV